MLVSNLIDRVNREYRLYKAARTEQELDRYWDRLSVALGAADDAGCKLALDRELDEYVLASEAES
jgi:hypothetical protein